MNRLAITLGILSLLVLYGCIEGQKSLPGHTAVQTETDFPEFLVGVWESNEFGWGFKFAPDGTISKLIHTVGVPIDVREGQYYSENPDYQGMGLFILGPCDVNYDLQSKYLKVSVILEYFRIEIMGDYLEGWSKDYFEGFISEKDLIWDVQWLSYSMLEGGTPPDVNSIDEHPVMLKFKKVESPTWHEH
ncbi:MAG: hypothetical protein WCZ89_09565 [Phycisphaerae bacterium]